MSLRLGDVAVSKPRVEVGEPRLGALGEDVELSRVAGIGCGKSENPRPDVEIKDPPLAAGVLPDVAIQVAGVHARHPWTAGEEEHSVSFGRPDEPGAVTGAHVVDHAVIR